MFSNIKKSATMEDVAKAAGVSIGTVDRVVHERKDVSDATRKRVLAVIEEVGYKPNIHASILSRKRSYMIVAIIPHYQKGEFWELIYEGLMKAAQEAQSWNVSVKVLYYNEFELESFRKACVDAIAAEPDGVVMPPIYREETIKLVSQLAEKSVKVVYVDTKLDDTDYFGYYGMSLFHSGYLAADLLVGKSGAVKEVVCFNIDRGAAPPNASILRRHEGFVAYLNDHNVECRLIDCLMSPHDNAHNMNIFDSFFEKHPNINHVITFNSRAHIISDWMEIRGVDSKNFVGFDILERNVKALKKGVITTLIGTRTNVDSYNAVMSLANYFVMRQEPEQADNYSPLDILNRHNIDFYRV